MSNVVELEAMRKDIAQIRTLLISGKRPEPLQLERSHGHRDYDRYLWTMEREQRYQQHHCANPEHVAKLRAGIQEFRALLESRDRSRC